MAATLIIRLWINDIENMLNLKDVNLKRTVLIFVSMNYHSHYLISLSLSFFSFFLFLILSLSLSPSHSLSYSLSLSHTHTHKLSLSLSSQGTKLLISRLASVRFINSRANPRVYIYLSIYPSFYPIHLSIQSICMYITRG